MNHKILATLLVALGAGGTVSAIAVTNPGLIGLTSSVNWCAGVEFSDLGDTIIRLTNRNPEAVRITSLGINYGSRADIALQSLGTFEWRSGVSGNLDIRTELVARSEVKACSHTVTVAPSPQRVESFEMVSYSRTGSTEMVLNLRNTGSGTINLVQYYVRDSAGTVCQTDISGWSVAANEVKDLHAILPGGCPFSYQIGFTYRVQVQTARGLQVEWAVQLVVTYALVLEATVGSAGL